MWKTLRFDDRFADKPSPIEFAFESEDGVLRNGQSGFGKVVYPEGSVYTGSLIFIDGRFEKYGFGEQDFTRSTMTADVLGGGEEHFSYKFVGFYDYRTTDWIYGNGIMYFRDKNQRPSAFIKGFFIGHIVECDWEGAFSEDLLLPGFTAEMEIEQKPHSQRVKLLERKIQGLNTVHTVLVGDSWFEFYENYRNEFHGKSVLNLGIGGSTYDEWVKHHIKGLLAKIHFERVIVNLGFNDLHHFCETDELLSSVEKFVNAIRNLNPTVEFFITSVSPSPKFKGMLSKERRANALLKSYCESNGLNYVDTVGLFMNGDYYANEFETLFSADRMHLNEKGYEVWRNAFIDLI